ncbi:MAG: ACP S-malonyltransferase [Robiginitomaculum sp.]
MTKQTALVVCPGRGTYNAKELGYFNKYHSDKKFFLHELDTLRQSKGQRTISELDGAGKFSSGTHGTGENASLLIYACAMADFHAINREKYDIVAITGNSMGWYLALAASGTLSLMDGAHLVNEMGALMHKNGSGGQIVYPIVDSEWKTDPKRVQLVQNILEDSRKTKSVKIYTSIKLGGMIVFAANDAGLKYLMQNLPEEEHFPLKLNNHNAFHSPILDAIVPMAKSNLSASIFTPPSTPLIDGQGVIWQPYLANTQSLYDYTLGEQINSTYDFSAAINVGIKEFAPDKIIVLGPGTTMSAPVAQELIEQKWLNFAGKEDFKFRQSDDPFVISMGMDDQRKFAL